MTDIKSNNPHLTGGEIHTIALFDSPKIGNSMIPVVDNFHPSNIYILNQVNILDSIVNRVNTWCFFFQDPGRWNTPIAIAYPSQDALF